MVLIISDATMMILIAKLELLDILSILFDKVCIPEQVYKEVVEQGKTGKRLDALAIEKSVQDNRIQVQKINHSPEKNKIMNDFNIHEGEAEAILLYLEMNADLLGTDDYRTLQTCKILKIHYFTTPMFLLKIVNNHHLSVEQGLQKLDDLKKIGWYKNEILDYFREEMFKQK